MNPLGRRTSVYKQIPKFCQIYCKTPNCVIIANEYVPSRHAFLCFLFFIFTRNKGINIHMTYEK